MGRRSARRNAALADFLTSNRGSDYMIRNALLCTIATLTLAACGGSSESSSTAASTSADTDTASQLVAPNAGLIDRSQGVGGDGSAASVASNTASNTAGTTSASSGGSSSTASTGSGASVGTGVKVTTPVKV